MRVLVCGSRDWRDDMAVYTVLEGLRRHAAYAGSRPFVVIEGSAQGADRAASNWARERARFVRHERYKADWNRHGKAAGPIRNQQMLDEGKPDVVWAFKSRPVSAGTDDMIRRAHKAGLPVYVVSRPQGDGGA